MEFFIKPNKKKVFNNHSCNKNFKT